MTHIDSVFLLRSLLLLHFAAAFYVGFFFFTLRDLFTVLRGFYDFVVGEMGVLFPCWSAFKA